MTTSSEYTFFATCAKSLESLLEDELTALDASSTRQTVAGVYFTGSLLTAYRAAMYSRLANRIIVILAEKTAANTDELYDAADSIDWLLHMRSKDTFAIAAAGSTEQLRHTQFVAQRIKDAIVDQFREAGQSRPNVEKHNPDIRIHAVIKKGRVMLGVELTRGSLHRRGYRLEQGEAPMKETLAAGLLMRAGWRELSKTPDPVIYDPMCGAGTLLIEAILMAQDIAPGLLREDGFSHWPHHQQTLIDQVQQEAEQRRALGKDWQGQAIGSDQDLRTLGMARRNAERAGVWDLIEFNSALVTEASAGKPVTLLITNPPYAERLGADAEVMQIYQQLGELIRREARGAAAAVFTARPEWGKLLGIHSHRQYALFNGQLPAKLLLFNVDDESVYQRPAKAVGADLKITLAALDDGGQMLANRLRKNLKNIGKWARQQGISCYRLYDADIPEFAFAIDIYADIEQRLHVHLQEYKPPLTVNEADAALRRRQAVLAVQHVMELSADRVSIKVRERQKGKQQYQALNEQGDDIIVAEGDAQLIVNLHRYLDTGLFLDHRPIRRYVREHAQDKEVLNLFCYTGSVSVQAALGGARRTVSVDLSKTYLNWARRNLAQNQLNLRQHELVEMDCLTYLQKNRQSFDLIFLDPPTFSNSKSTEHVLDIQRDHIELIDLCMQRLRPDGLLIFSNNMRRFKMAPELGERYDLSDYSKKSLDKDFARNERIHQTWLIRARPTQPA
jgi:23S rRNA (guanine2445-N2)-methyltransferase / 23S rRNA (guanine2069-N7)-methyltransferase